ncbi:MAG: DUF1957 domain-containing protein [Verrucomicrobiales bacterium]|nr:DUF1957 domain-containing protein [Verrucomicrobiales bacterium]
MSRYCSLVLHAHVPWVRNPEEERCLEEDWLFGAVAECYVPLLDMLYQLREDEVPMKVTINMSPPLLYMLRDRLMTRRALAYFDRTIKLCQDELERGESTGFTDLAKFYLERFEGLRELYVDKFNCDLVGAFGDLHESGHVELTASAATHGVLPLLMKVPESVTSQIRVGLSEFEKTFGYRAKGFWLPECAFAPALSNLLVKEGIEWTLVEQHGLTHVNNGKKIFPHRPAKTIDGLRVFSRDNDASQHVWNAEEGYPADPRYRDYFRDIGIEAPMGLLEEYLDGSEIRRFTGLKFFRRTGSAMDKKEIYDLTLAHQALEENSVHFINSRGAQLASLDSQGIEQPIVVCAFDASLFGHWWFEGVEFLNRIFRKAAERSDFEFTTPSEYDAIATNLPQAMPVSSSWGEGGFFETWMSENNNWINADLYDRGTKLCRMVQTHQESREGMSQERIDHRERCLRQLSRDLLMAQASDWGFLLNNEASHDYAEAKVRGYLDAFDVVWGICTSFGDIAPLDELEKRYPIFADIEWDLFRPNVMV